jgi:hypothetical protein
MLKEAPEPRAVPSPVPVPRYFYQDPIRLSAMTCAVLLMALPVPPLWLTAAAVAISQFNGVAMIVGILGEGWSLRLGRRSRAALLTGSMAADWTNTSVCTLLGALLLLRFFGPPQLVFALGLLALGIGILPDVRLCRLMLPPDPRAASGQLRRGYFFRDPVKIGGLVALLILCTLDRVSLTFIFLSMSLLQLNSALILVDKYLHEVPTEGTALLFRSRAIRLFLARDGQRLLLVLLPFAFVPFRLAVDEYAATASAAVIAGLIVVPDLLRLMGHSLDLVFGGAPRPSSATALQGLRSRSY